MREYPQNMHIIMLEECDSTNSYLKRNVQSLLARLPVLITSQRQTAGRGREKRNWISLHGKGLYSSFGFKLMSTENLNFLPLVAGLSVINTLEEIAGFRPRLKWPNDILIDFKKICGILIENVITQEEIFCIAGFGINLNQILEDFPNELHKRATSLKIITGNTFSPDSVNPVLAHFLFRWLEKLNSDAGDEIIDSVNTYCDFIKNKSISFHMPGTNAIVSGIFRGINHDGGLIFEDESGSNAIYYSGEIE